MRRPFWGVRRALICTLLVGVVLVLCAIRRNQADDSGFAPQWGPTVAPLSRPAPNPDKLWDFLDPAAPAISAGQAPENFALQTSAEGTSQQPATTATQTTPAPEGKSQSKFLPKLPPLKFPFSSFGSMADSSSTKPAGAPVSATATASTLVLPRSTNPATLPAASGNESARPIDDLSLPLTTDPLSGAPSNSALAGDFSGTEKGTAAAPATPLPPVKGIHPWETMQAAYRQLIDSRPGFGTPAPAAEVVSQPTSSQIPQKTESAPPDPMVSRIAYIRADNVQPPTAQSPDGPPTIYSANPMVEGGAPADVGYAGPSGCGCGSGRSPDGSDICPNCGGWQPGTCSTHNPNGSCVLQRLACCLCKPYPDCSNGCVDFCHSWIFHEDDCWLFSNHKCCADGCGPYPYGGCETDGLGKGNGCGCGSPIQCVPPPDLYFTVGAIALTADNSARNQTIVTNTAGAAVLSTNDLGFDWRAGPSFLLGYRPTKMDAWEISYFGLNDWSTEQSVSGSVSLPGTLGTIANFSGANSMDVSYSSRIDNAEINYFWHHDSPEVMWMAGFRYFHLDERLNILSVTDTGDGVYDIRTGNDMAGGQLGVRLRGCCTRFEWDLTAKAGAFGNSVGQAQSVVNVDEPPTIRNTGHHGGDWAFVGDIGANASFYLCKNWCAMAGYNVMWVDGVALAPDQLDFTNNPSSGGGLNRNGNVLYQGAHVGLGCRW